MSWAIGEEIVDIFRITPGNVLDFLEQMETKAARHLGSKFKVKELSVAPEVLDAYTVACSNERVFVNTIQFDRFNGLSYKGIVLTRGKQRDYSVGVNVHVGR